LVAADQILNPQNVIAGFLVLDKQTAGSLVPSNFFHQTKSGWKKSENMNSTKISRLAKIHARLAP